MFSHVMVGSNDIARSKKFYDALFGAMGGKPGVQDEKGRLIYAYNGGLFLVTKPIDGKSATHANGGTIGFAMTSPELPTPGTRLGLRMAAWQLKTRLAFVKAASARCISPTFAIPTAINCAHFIAWRPPELSSVENGKGHLSGRSPAHPSAIAAGRGP